MTGIERNLLETKIKLAKRTIKKAQNVYEVLSSQAKSALETVRNAEIVLKELETEKDTDKDGINQTLSRIRERERIKLGKQT